MKPKLPDFDAQSFLQHCTSATGVYLMRDSSDTILYVGKARNLKKRLSSYFKGTVSVKKTQCLVEKIAAIHVTVTPTENEALLLESNLIKKHRPRYNVLLRDDKSYPYLYLSRKHPFPALLFHRGSQKAPGRYFGPYPNSYSVKQTLALLQKLFKLRACHQSFFQNRSRPCLQYQIKRCAGPCVGLVKQEEYAETVKEATLFLEGKSDAVMQRWIKKMEHAAAQQAYEKAAHFRDQLKQLRQIQEQHVMQVKAGESDVLGLTQYAHSFCVTMVSVRQGRVLGHKAYFPKVPLQLEAQEVLVAFLSQYYLTEPRRHPIPRELILPPDVRQDDWLIASLNEAADHSLKVRMQVRGTRAAWQALAQRNAEESLQQYLKQKTTVHAQLQAIAALLNLPEIPQRIECFDISHTQGEATVASCVVFDKDGANTSYYRRYNIQGIIPGDDYAAMTQALQRRYRTVKDTDKPDILVMDGGKGQLQRAVKVLTELQLNEILLLGIAKGPQRKAGLETVLLHGAKEPIAATEHPTAFLLLQHIRDEAHRFAINAHRKQRDKKRQHSQLIEIPGIGAKRRKALISHFGGLQEIKQASLQELAKIPGISLGLAERIYQFFQNC